MPRLIAEFFTDESGQDLIEYALLATLIGLASIAVFDVLMSAIGGTYASWESSTASLWEPSAPSGS